MAGSAPRKSTKYKPTAWGAEALMDLELPSGQLCEVRRPGVTGLITAGLMDSLDSLTGIVQTEHVERVNKGEEVKLTRDDVKAFTGDKDKLRTAMDLMDKILEYVVTQPSVLRPVVRDDRTGKPILRPKVDRDSGEPVFEKDGTTAVLEEVPLEERDYVPGQVYTPMVDLMDKTYIFQFVVGGVSDLQQFRQEFGASLGSLGLGEAVSVPAKRDGGDN